MMAWNPRAAGLSESQPNAERETQLNRLLSIPTMMCVTNLVSSNPGCLVDQKGYTVLVQAQRNYTAGQSQQSTSIKPVQTHETQGD